MSDSYAIQAADNMAKKKKKQKSMSLNWRVYTLAEALEEAGKGLTKTQEKYREKYGDRYACAPGSNGVGCVFNLREE